MQRKLEQCLALPFVFTPRESHAPQPGRHQTANNSGSSLYRASGRARRDSKYIALSNISETPRQTQKRRLFEPPFLWIHSNSNAPK